MGSLTSILLIVSGSSVEMLLKMLTRFEKVDSRPRNILFSFLEELIGKRRVNEGGAFPAIILFM